MKVSLACLVGLTSRLGTGGFQTCCACGPVREIAKSEDPKIAVTNETMDDRVFVSLTNDPLDPTNIMDLVRSPEAGAIVLFAGTTRDNFAGMSCIIC